jgi:DNA-directed RNA polymerase specialized sigma24 family protein
MGLRQMFPVQTKRIRFTKARDFAEVRRKTMTLRSVNCTAWQGRDFHADRHPLQPTLEPVRCFSIILTALQTALFPSTTLAEFYRFALLLTGDAKAAEQVMTETITEMEPKLAQVRNETSRVAKLVTRLRDRCLKNQGDGSMTPRLLRTDEARDETPEVLRIEAFLVAQRFHALPEPERSALALFYLEFFTIEQIAELLKMDAWKLPDTIGRARKLLQESLAGMRAEAKP